MESVSTSCLIDLAFDLSVDWRKLARALGLANEVQRIGEDYRKNVIEQAYRMLQTWKQRNGTQATYQALGEALTTQVLSRNDLAQKYCEGGNRGSLETEIDLQGHLKSGQVSMSDMISITNDLGKDWLWVGRLLGLEDATLDGIRDAHTQMYECSYKMLELWVERRITQATYECLARALLHRTVGMRDVAEKYCLDHRESASASSVPPEEGIEPLNEKMEHLQLSGLSKETGVAAGSPVNIQSSTEGETVNRSETGSAGTVPMIVIKMDIVTFQGANSRDPMQQEEAKRLIMSEMTNSFLETNADDIALENIPLCLHYYLKGVLDLIVREAREGCLGITIECCTLEILERLWKDYCSGHLNAVAEERLLTDDIKRRYDVESVKMKTTILKEDYMACKQFLTGNSDPPRLTSQQQLGRTNKPKLMVSDEEKRWIVIGIAIRKVTAPVLRDFISQGMDTHYANLDTYCSGLTTPCTLKTLTYRQVNTDPNLRRLKFQNINNNLHLHGNHKNLYNYNINSSVDLAKLFLPDYLARFSAFDESLNISAILRLLGCTYPAPIFPSPIPLMSIQTSADDVRENVSNKWGICGVTTDWTEVLFNDCFSKLETLVRSLGLTGGMEKIILDQLFDWKTKVMDIVFMEQLEQGFAKTHNKVEQLEKDVSETGGKVKQLEQEVRSQRMKENKPGSTPPVPDDCIIKNFIAILPYKVWRELIIKLDPVRPFQGDYRDLASEMGCTVEQILYFQSLKNPTEAVLTTCASSASIEDLCNKLEAIGRRDARLLIDEWVKTKDCKCAVCNN